MGWLGLQKVSFALDVTSQQTAPELQKHMKVWTEFIQSAHTGLKTRHIPCPQGSQVCFFRKEKKPNSTQDLTSNYDSQMKTLY